MNNKTLIFELLDNRTSSEKFVNNIEDNINYLIGKEIMPDLSVNISGLLNLFMKSISVDTKPKEN